MFGTGHNGLSSTKQGSGRAYLTLPQNKAKTCPIIVTLPIKTLPPGLDAHAERQKFYVIARAQSQF
jgi:hypothetical protein